MSRRIDIELTSVRDDGTWTWRAAGAKQPKGLLDGKLLYEGAKSGDVVRAEADFEIEGITIISVFPPKEKRSEPDRLEIVGPARTQQPLVTSSLVPKQERRGRDRDRDRDRDGAPRGPRREGDRGPRPGRPPRGEGDDRGGRGRGEGGDRARTGAGAGAGAGGRGEGRRSDARPESRGPRGEGRPPRAPQPERPAPPKPKRLNPGHKHRNAVLESLSPEQRPVAEQVLRGGIPAVRSAIEQENEKAKAEGRPPVKAEGFLAMAEEMLPRLKTAEWHDRAEAAAQSVDEISLRDLRAVVTGADAAARDDETRSLAVTLREALERRVNEQQEGWVNEMTQCLDEGRLVRALRLAARPPDPGSRVPAELSTRLTDAASAAMAPDAAPDRWAVLIDAVANSPVRRSVQPAGLPPEPGEQLLQLAREASGRIPALAAMLGIDMPPPPRAGKMAGRPTPPRPGGRPRGPRPAAPRPGGGAGDGGGGPRSAQPSPATEPAAAVDEPAPAAPAESALPAEPGQVEPAPAAPAESALPPETSQVEPAPAAPAESALPAEPGQVEAAPIPVQVEAEGEAAQATSTPEAAPVEAAAMPETHVESAGEPAQVTPDEAGAGATASE